MVNRITTISLLCLAIAGCSRADEPSVEPAAVATPAAPEAGAAAQPAVESPHTPDLAEPAAESPLVAEFSPPFPDRLELFEPPKRAQGTVRIDDEGGETVELKGFVNVDQPRVVLSIDGVISPIPEGGEKYGVQVIAIQPPSVVLQRGRNRWTATLE